MGTTSDKLCGKEVYNIASDGITVVGDICPCVLLKDHEGICLCQHRIHMRYQSDAVDATIMAWDAYEKFKKGQQ